MRAASICPGAAIYLGFNNKTCGTAGTGQQPLARPSKDGSKTYWKSWEVTVTGYHSYGAPLVVFGTGVPQGKTIRCPGQLAAVDPATCGSSTVDIDSTAQQEWRLVAVSGAKDTYKIVANFKKSGCARYLAVGTDGSVKLVNSGSSDLAQVS